jgi:hypothetical protein
MVVYSLSNVGGKGIVVRGRVRCSSDMGWAKMDQTDSDYKRNDIEHIQ